MTESVTNQDILDAISDFAVRVEGCFEAVDLHFEAIDRRFEVVDQNFRIINQRFDDFR